MDPEIKQDFERSLKKTTFFDKIRYKIKLMAMKESKIKNIRNILISYGKPIIETYYPTKKNKLDELFLFFFEERIISLPKENVISLYRDFQKFRKANSKEAKDYFLEQFIVSLHTHYALNGWFLKKCLKFANRNKV